MPEHFVRVTDIGEYIRHNSCQRRFKLGHRNQALYKSLPFTDRPFHVLDVVLSEAGRKREEEWADFLDNRGILALQSPETRSDPILWADFVPRLAGVPAGESAFAREVEIRGEVGAFNLVGRIDFVLLRHHPDGRPYLRLVECKASRRDRVYHRIQVTLYHMMVRDLLAAAPIQLGAHTIGPDDVECVVARIDEDTNQVQSLLDVPPFHMRDTLAADARRLLAVDGHLDRVLRADLDSLPYQLDVKCDDCLFSVHCLSESARQRRLELLGLRPATCRALRALGLDTLDALAAVDPEDASSDRLRNDPRLTDSLEQLQTLAETRQSTLPGSPAQSFHVRSLPYAGKGQLPEHIINDVPLVRIYLTVSYDYVENRVNGLAAHLTRSSGHLQTPFVQNEEGKYRPSPDIREQHHRFDPASKKRVLDKDGPLSDGAIELCRIQTIPWSGRYELDNGAEMQLLQGFLRELVDAIAEIADTDEAPIHFYLWSRQEMKHLLEACSRVGAGLMRHLKELLGCRESLEQMIYSCLQDEVRNRFALGWTGRGLVVATALRWFGKQFHWVRRVGYRGREVDLERAFSRDIFDFRTTLFSLPDGQWAKDGRAPGATSHRYEVRSRNFDTLSAPYWRAYWGTLPPESDYPERSDVRAALRDYQASRQPGLLEALLKARSQSLRWLDERIQFKNPDIVKPMMPIAALPSFQLTTRHVADAAVDFLKLDHHVKIHDWLHTHFIPPYVRVARGLSLLIKDLEMVDVVLPGQFKADGSPKTSAQIRAMLDLDAAHIDVEAISARISIGEGSFVRLARRSADPQEGQSFGNLLYGKTAVINALDWSTGVVMLSIIPSWQGAQYVLPSQYFNEKYPPYEHATLDASVSDFVADRIETRLTDTPARPLKGRHILRWFDPTRPEIPAMPPIDTSLRDRITQFLTDYRWDGHGLAQRRIDAILNGIDSRIQLIQGPPGTGKTMVSAFAVLSRILARHPQGAVILIAAHTHTAVDTLLARILSQRDGFIAAARQAGLPMPGVSVAKVDSRQSAERDGQLELLQTNSCISRIKKLARTSTVVIGGTVNAVLKMVERGINRKTLLRKEPEGFLTPLLIIDEASMMVFSHFLALASLTQPTGQIMLAGDHRQLSPIIAHDWDSEDRPPSVLYKPYVSAYEAVLNLSTHRRNPARSVVIDRLEKTWRLPAIIRELIRPLYIQDEIALTGPKRGPEPVRALSDDPWSVVWRGGHRLLLALHDEVESQQSNPVEAEVIARILSAEDNLPADSVAVVTPHRAQRALLTVTLKPWSDGPVGLIDTVERLQGGERPTIFFSATVSDPVVISQTAEFILNINRSNVAFSRTQERLVVVCSRALLDHIPTEVEHYESALLWKHLRTLCSQEVATMTVQGSTVALMVPPPPPTPAQS